MSGAATASRANAKSLAVWKRRPASFSRARRTIRSTAGGVGGPMSGGSSSWVAVRTSVGVAPWNGGAPESIS